MIKDTSIRAIVLVGLVMGLSVLLLIVGMLVSERKQRQHSTQFEVSEQWSREQQVHGPYLRVNGTIKRTEQKLVNGSMKDVIMTSTIPLNFVASELAITGNINPQQRKRGIYEVILYDTQLYFKGNFADFKTDDEAVSEIDWSSAEIYFGISDMRGLNKNIIFNIGTEKLQLGNTNQRELLKAKLLKIDGKPENLPFNFTVDFRGSEHLQFSPTSLNTTINLTSSWVSPSFYGSFLPSKHSITKEGFTANWNVLEMNRNLPNVDQSINVSKSQPFAFGVKLIEPNDNYQKNERAVKYGILIISLTFLGFFFTEIIMNKRVSIIQYGFVGLALIVFYCLLLSFSEIITFNPAYMLSSVMTVGLIYMFCRGIFKSFKPPIVIALITTVAYAFIYVIIQLEDTALLVGSLGLFVILAITMWMSRKINWAHEREVSE